MKVKIFYEICRIFLRYFGIYGIFLSDLPLDSYLALVLLF